MTRKPSMRVPVDLSHEAHVVASIDINTGEVVDLRIYSADHSGLTLVAKTQLYATLYSATHEPSFESARQACSRWIHREAPRLAQKFRGGVL